MVLYIIYYTRNFAVVKSRKEVFFGKNWKEREDRKDSRFYFKSWEDSGRILGGAGISSSAPRKFPENSQQFPAAGETPANRAECSLLAGLWTRRRL